MLSSIPNYRERQQVLHKYGLLDSEPEEIFNKITHLAAQVFEVPVALISLMDYDTEQQKFKSCYGVDARQTDLNTSFCLTAVLNYETLVVPDALQDERFRDYSLVVAEPHMRFYAGAPLKTPEGIALGALALIDFVPRPALTQEQIDLLETLADVVVDEIMLRHSLQVQFQAEQQLYEYKLKPAREKLEQYEQELFIANTKLDVARSIQQSVQPCQADIDAADLLDIATYVCAADAVGGDYHDIITANDKVYIGIGDVTGHGLESGLLMVMVQTAIHALVQSGKNTLKDIVSVINKTLYAQLERSHVDKSMTLALLAYEAKLPKTDTTAQPSRGNVTLSGQHEQVLHVSVAAEVSQIDTFALGFPLGLEDNIDQYVQTHALTLEQGEGLILYTDGITEAESLAGELYGLDRLEAAVARAWPNATTAEEVKNEVVADLYTFIGEQDVLDDITLIVLRQS